MNITATHINYLHICHRKLWLFSNAIQMEHTSDLVAMGKHIGEKAYPQRAERYRELELDGIKIDYYDAKKKVVHEIKKSAAKEDAHIAQVKYYLYILKENGIDGATGILEYPKLRQTETVFLNKDDEAEIKKWVKEVEKIAASETCPKRLTKSKCRNCSYYDFCWIEELDED